MKRDTIKKVRSDIAEYFKGAGKLHWGLTRQVEDLQDQLKSINIIVATLAGFAGFMFMWVVLL